MNHVKDGHIGSASVNEMEEDFYWLVEIRVHIPSYHPVISGHEANTEESRRTRRREIWSRRKCLGFQSRSNYLPPHPTLRPTAFVVKTRGEFWYLELKRDSECLWCVFPCNFTLLVGTAALGPHLGIIFLHSCVLSIGNSLSISGREVRGRKRCQLLLMQPKNLWLLTSQWIAYPCVLPSWPNRQWPEGGGGEGLVSDKAEDMVT